MSASQYNDWASRKAWSPLPEEWPGYGYSPTSKEFEDAVTEFQRSTWGSEASLIVDGKLGPKTFAQMSEYYRTPEEAPSSEVHGIDLSHYQGNVDWESVAHGTDPQIEFAIVKASEGVGYPLEYAQLIVSGYMPGYGIPLCYYHFGTPHTSNGRTPQQDAHDEAVAFSWSIERLFPPCLIEFGSGREADVWCALEKDIPKDEDGVPFLTPLQVLAWCLSFAEAIEARGHLLGWYTSRQWLEEFVAHYELLLFRSDGTERPFWVPRYGENTGEMPDPEEYPPNEKVPKEWGSYDVWQGTSTALIRGVEEECDLDVAAIERAVWRAKGYL